MNTLNSDSVDKLSNSQTSTINTINTINKSIVTDKLFYHAIIQEKNSVKIIVGKIRLESEFDNFVINYATNNNCDGCNIIKINIIKHKELENKIYTEGLYIYKLDNTFYLVKKEISKYQNIFYPFQSVKINILEKYELIKTNIEFEKNTENIVKNFDTKNINNGLILIVSNNPTNNREMIIKFLKTKSQECLSKSLIIRQLLDENNKNEQYENINGIKICNKMKKNLLSKYTGFDNNIIVIDDMQLHNILNNSYVQNMLLNKSNKLIIIACTNFKNISKQNKKNIDYVFINENTESDEFEKLKLLTFSVDKGKMKKFIIHRRNNFPNNFSVIKNGVINSDETFFIL